MSAEIAYQLWGVTAFVATLFGVELIRRWAVRRNLLDIPIARSSHVTPAPRGGGLAIVLVNLTGGGLLFSTLAGGLPAPGSSLYLMGAALIAGVSWLDDVRSLPVSSRLTIHAVSALIVMVAFGYWQNAAAPVLGILPLDGLGLPITLLWMVGLTNAYNFMDGIDGMAASQAVVAGAGWSILGGLSDQPLISGLGVLVAASSLGFLTHNWPPARIFMGDVGSAFLGFAFAALPVIAAPTGGRWPVIGALLVWPFVFDTSFTFLSRLRNRKPVFAAHRSHLYQRLVISGLSHRRVTAIYILLSLLTTVTGVLYFGQLPFTDYLAVGVMVGVGGLLLIWTRQRERLTAK